MNETVLLDQMLEQALKLSPKQRLQLAERLVSSVERNIEAPPAPEEHWGKNLLHLLDEIGPIELAHPEIEDPTEWVKQIRRDDAEHRDLNWGQNE